MQGKPRQSWSLDFTPLIADFRYWTVADIGEGPGGPLPPPRHLSQGLDDRHTLIWKSDPQLLGSSLFSVDSGYQSLVGFRINFSLLYFGFQRPDFWIPQANFSRIRDPGSIELLTLGEMTATVGEVKIATGAVTKTTHLHTCINPFSTPLCRQ